MRAALCTGLASRDSRGSVSPERGERLSTEQSPASAESGLREGASDTYSENSCVKRIRLGQIFSNLDSEFLKIKFMNESFVI